MSATIYINARAYRQFSHRVQHSFRVEQQVLSLVATVNSAEALQHAFLLTDDERLLASYYALLPHLQDESRLLERMVRTDTEQRHRAHALRTLVEQRRNALENVMREYRQHGRNGIRKSLDHLAQNYFPDELEQGARLMRNEESILLQQYQQRRDALATRTITLTLICLSACLLLLWRAFVLAIREQQIRVRSEAHIVDAYRDLAESLEQSRRLAGQLARLSLLGEMLQSCRKLEEAFEVICSSMPELLPGSFGQILMLDTDTGQLTQSAHWGTSKFICQDTFSPDDCLALRRGHPYPPPNQDATFHCAHLDVPPGAAEQILNYLCMPLVTQGETLGVLHIQPGGELDEELRRLTLTIAEQLALSLGNLRLQESLRSQSIRDALTGLFNRRYLESSLGRELLRCARDQAPLTVLMLDMDHFKQFNDSHGHQAGDRRLVEFAEVLRSGVRGSDLACRYGGEEFTLVLPGVGLEAAMARANQIREATASLPDGEFGDQPPTCSIGVALYPNHGQTPYTLIQAADRALYQAKRGGRDRVEVARSD
nr:GGDEF domain-containing protein [Oleiagrimonas sp. C23AA]